MSKCSYRTAEPAVTLLSFRCIVVLNLRIARMPVTGLPEMILQDIFLKIFNDDVSEANNTQLLLEQMVM